MSRTLEEVIAILEADINDLPRENDYDEGFAAGVMQAIFLFADMAADAAERPINVSIEVEPEVVYHE